METTILILSLLLKYGPTVAAQAKELLKKETVTEEDWKALFAKAQEPWIDYVPKTTT